MYNFRMNHQTIIQNMVNNQPLFPGSAKNNKISIPMQTFIDEQKTKYFA